MKSSLKTGNGDISRAIITYYALKKHKEELEKSLATLRKKIIEAMKKDGFKEINCESIKALYLEKENLIKDYDKIREVLGNYWNTVARKQVTYTVDRKDLERLLKEGKITEEDYKKIIEIKEVLIVEKI